MATARLVVGQAFQCPWMLIIAAAGWVTIFGEKYRLTGKQFCDHGSVSD